MSSFGDDPIKDLGFVVFPASAGLDQRDCLFCAFSLHLWFMTCSVIMSQAAAATRGVGLGSRDCTGTWMGHPRLGC